MIDLRLPIGIFFVLVGIIMTAYGVISPHNIPNITEKVNINLYWGIVLFLFGAPMTIFGWMADAKARAEQKKKK
jgi:Na+/H+ antiporter NhaD/arsenite permease-like protein